MRYVLGFDKCIIRSDYKTLCKNTSAFFRVFVYGFELKDKSTRLLMYYTSTCVVFSMRKFCIKLSGQEFVGSLDLSLCIGYVEICYYAMKLEFKDVEDEVHDVCFFEEVLLKCTTVDTGCVNIT